jgi:hypothetical protein
MGGADVRRAAQSWGYLAGLALAACGQTDVLGTIEAAVPTVSAPQAGASAPTVDAGEEAAGDPVPGNPVRTSAPGCATAASIFDRALCACGSLSTLGDLRTARMTVTPGAVPSSRADVGVVGTLQSAAFVGPIDGDLTIAGLGLNALVAVDGRVTGALRVAGDLALRGAATVASDAWLGGQLLGDGLLAVQGDAYRGFAPPGAPPIPVAATLEVAGDVVTQAFTLEPPCACDAEPAVDVAAVVALAAVDNDNTRAGFAPDSLTHAAEGEIHELTGGRLFAHAVSAAGDLVLRVTGRNALFVGGDVQVGGALRAELADGAELELWIARDVAVAGPIALGSREQIPVPPPAADAVATPNEEWIVNLYAPQVDLSLPRDTTVTGALFVRSIVSVGDLHVEYDSAVTARRSICDE